MTYPPRWNQPLINRFNGYCQLIVLITLSATTKFDWQTPYHVETRSKKVLKLYRIHNVYVYITYPPRWHQPLINWFNGYCQLIVLITLSATTKFDWLTPYHVETRPKKVLKLYRIHNVYVYMTYPPRWHQPLISWFNGYCQLIVLNIHSQQCLERLMKGYIIATIHHFNSFSIWFGKLSP